MSDSTTSSRCDGGNRLELAWCFGCGIDARPRCGVPKLGDCEAWYGGSLEVGQDEEVIDDAA